MCVDVHEVVVDYVPRWKKWPDTDDADYSQIRAQVGHRRAGELSICSHVYPVHAAFRSVDRSAAGPGCWEFARSCFSEAVIEQQLADLREYAKYCKVIYWPHARRLHKRVTSELPSLFPLRILRFGDDCPGSSEKKTFPFAEDFNVLVYHMHVWRYDTGERTDAKYASLGVPYRRLSLLGSTTGLQRYLRTDQFSVGEKADDLVKKGRYPTLGLVWVGCYTTLNLARKRFMDDMAIVRKQLHTAGLRTKLHGAGYKVGDGLLTPFRVDDGATIGPLYTNALFGVNFPMSSLFNTRLFDLWLCGTVQLIHDKNNELAGFGAIPFVHYLPFDGTADGAVATMLAWKDRRVGLSKIMRAGEKLALKLMQDYHLTHVLDQMYQDHRELLL